MFIREDRVSQCLTNKAYPNIKLASHLAQVMKNGTMIGNNYFTADRDFDSMSTSDLMAINRNIHARYNDRIRALMAACRQLAKEKNGIEQASKLILAPHNRNTKLFHVNAYAFFGFAALLHADPVRAGPYIDHIISTWSKSDQEDVRWFLSHSGTPAADDNDQ